MKSWFLVFIGTLLLVGCGGGGGGSSDTVTLSGHVVNGPISGATVDIFNTNGAVVGTTTTDSNGFYEHSGLPPSANGYRVVANNGLLDDLPYLGALSAHCNDSPCRVTPLSTAVDHLAGLEQIGYVDAHQKLFDWLGLEEDPFIADFQGEAVSGVDLDIIRTEILEATEGVTDWVAKLVEDAVEGSEPPQGWGPEPTEYLVSTNVGSGGSVTPANSTVAEGSTVSFTVTPETDYSIDGVTGCGGTFAGSTYTTGTINGDCTVTTSFALNSYTVIFQDYDGTELKVESVNHGGSATAPTDHSRTGYSFSGWSPDYGNITGDLTVTAQYTINSYTVTPEAGTGGNINPATAQSVNHGSTVSFTVTPETGYSIDEVTGCGGTLAGGAYTTGAITGDCTVNVNFKDKFVDITGYVVNGPIAAASVEIFNDKGILVGSTFTDSLGYFEYDGLREAEHYKIVAKNGFYDGIPYLGSLSAICSDLTCFVTPLTSLVEHLSQPEDMEYLDANQQLMMWLGNEEDPFIMAYEGNPLPDVNLNAIRNGIKSYYQGVDEWIDVVLARFENDSLPGDNWIGDIVPIADAGEDQSVVTGSTVTLDGSRSSTGDGSELTYQWVFVSMPTDSMAVLSSSNTVNPTFVADLDGEYVISLKVQDSAFTSQEHEVRIISTTPDFPSLFAKEASKSGVLINGYYQAGSSFSFTITNLSSIHFEIYRAVLLNDNVLVSFTEDPSLLGGGQLAPDESVGITVTLNTALQDNGFEFHYYLRHPESGHDFAITHVWPLKDGKWIY